mmetsp:Transcript_8549/g.7572  ORF Transcript_8549/g.7572 Transcript_8549/m.7572 type:complete len:89 (-) Transcript_8549:64-330(-)
MKLLEASSRPTTSNHRRVISLKSEKTPTEPTDMNTDLRDTTFEGGYMTTRKPFMTLDDSPDKHTMAPKFRKKKPLNINLVSTMSSQIK